LYPRLVDNRALDFKESGDSEDEAMKPGRWPYVDPDEDGSATKCMGLPPLALTVTLRGARIHPRIACTHEFADSHVLVNNHNIF
jgi:hypothetical protein